MQRALEPFEQFGDAVDLEALAQAEIERRDGVGEQGLACLGLEPGADGVVDDRAERATRRSSRPLQSGGDIVVERQGRSQWHITKSAHQAS